MDEERPLQRRRLGLSLPLPSQLNAGTVGGWINVLQQGKITLHAHLYRCSLLSFFHSFSISLSKLSHFLRFVQLFLTYLLMHPRSIVGGCARGRVCGLCRDEQRSACIPLLQSYLAGSREYRDLLDCTWQSTRRIRSHDRGARPFSRHHIGPCRAANGTAPPPSAGHRIHFKCFIKTQSLIC